MGRWKWEASFREVVAVETNRVLVALRLVKATRFEKGDEGNGGNSSRVSLHEIKLSELQPCSLSMLKGSIAK
jgi:hypothetical protein